MNYWRSGKGASSANKHSCKGGWKTCLATWALLSKTHLLTGRANLRLSHKEVSKPTAEDEARDLKASPLLSVLQPKTEVRSQVNIPPSRCLQHASGRDKTRPATPPPHLPYLQTPRALPILARELLQTVSKSLTVRAKPMTHLTQVEDHFSKKVIREIWHSSH